MTFQEHLEQDYVALSQRIQQRGVRAMKYHDPDALHDFRVDIKQLRALFRFIEWLAPEAFPSQIYFRAARQLFKASADLRDLHVQQELCRLQAREIGGFPHEYYNGLKHKEQFARRQFAAFAKFFPFEEDRQAQRRRILRAIDPLAEDAATRKIHARLAQQMLEIINFAPGGEIPAERLHPLRILAKETRYALHIAARCLPAFSDQTALDAALQRLHQALGKWHDGEIAKAHLREFAAECAAPLSPADTAAHDKLLVNIRAEQAAHLATFHSEWHAFLAANVPNQFNSKDR